MAEPYIGEIRMFAGNYAPVHWSKCNGGTIPIQQNPALFSIIGCTFGGDCRTSMGLPNLVGYLPVGTGQAPGMSYWQMGMHVGVESVAVQPTQMNHNHNMKATTELSGIADPTGRVLGPTPGSEKLYASAASPAATLHAASVSTAPGGGQAHNNMMPFQCVNYIICLDGVFPPRT
jgi:microcystin-dependent protein